MMRFDALVEAIGALRGEDLERWVEQELVAPAPGEQAGAWVFAEGECARVRLICTLHYDLEVEAETLPVVLSLLDQLYETRAALKDLGRAVAAQGPEVRTAILAELERAGRR